MVFLVVVVVWPDVLVVVDVVDVVVVVVVVVVDVIEVDLDVVVFSVEDVVLVVLDVEDVDSEVVLDCVTELSVFVSVCLSEAVVAVCVGSGPAVTVVTVVAVVTLVAVVLLLVTDVCVPVPVVSVYHSSVRSVLTVVSVVVVVVVVVVSSGRVGMALRSLITSGTILIANPQITATAARVPHCVTDIRRFFGMSAGSAASIARMSSSVFSAGRAPRRMASSSESASTRS